MNEKRSCGKKTTGNLIREIRHIHKLTQQDLAQKLGVGRTTIVGYEKGTITPSAQVMNKLHEEFNIPFDFFISNKRHLENDIEKDILTIILKLSRDEYDNIDETTKIYIKHTLQSITRTLTELEITKKGAR